ncbi:serine/threonine-protein kinase [Streptomyces zhihengii]|uniref:serine/threonine-protein kinase n=2 Tax=Streptomyces zhihengii TaxID=1818004 RepID=UPI0036ABFAC9
MRAGVVLDGRYELRERLGEGGMGEVWRGHDRRLDRAVAVKTVRDTARPLLLARLEREARAAGRLTHPHIVAVHDSNRVVFEGVPAVYLVMELLPGLPLSAELARGLPPVPQALEWAAQVADALAAVHTPEVGIVHRDLKPGNIMITHGLVKLLDFGIALLSGAADTSTRLTETGHVVGTVAYMAPEQCLGSRAIDGRTDLYALGCLLVTLLTGRPPFPMDIGMMGVLYHHVHEAPPLPGSRRPGIPGPVDALAERLLAKDPDDRPAHAAEVRDILRALAADIRTPAPPPAAAPPAGAVRPATTTAAATAPPAPAPATPATAVAAPTAAAGPLPAPRDAVPPSPPPDRERVRRRLDAVEAVRSNRDRSPADRDAQAARMLRALLPDLALLYGPDARETLAARLTLAESVATNDPEQAVALLEDLIPDLVRTRRRRSRLTRAARTALARERQRCW